MQELIEAIRSAVATGATAEQKTAGAQACRAILAALDAEPGRPIIPVGEPTPIPGAGVALEQVLDLAIARLRTIADRRVAHGADGPNSPRAATPASPPRPLGMRTPFVSAGDPRASLKRPPR